MESTTSHITVASPQRPGTSSSLVDGVCLVLIAGMLWVNALDVRMDWVRVFYGLMAGWLAVMFLVRRFQAWRAHKSTSDQSTSPGQSGFMLQVSNLGLALVTLILGMEAGARALPPMTNSSINYPGQRFVWPDRYLPRNSLGFNDAEPGPKGNQFCVLVLGDSYVEGAGVSRQERFCSRLKELLGTTHRDVQVVAAGIGGWNTQQEARFLERYGEALEPDVVVVAYVLNDAEGVDQNSGQPNQFEVWLQTRLNSYLSYRLYRWRKSAFSNYWDAVREQHQPDSAGWDEVKSALEKIAAWCERHRAACQLVVLPIFSTDAEQGRPIMQQVVDQGRLHGIHAYHALDDFSMKWADFAVSPFDAHPNAKGHRRIAERILRELTSDPKIRPYDSSPADR